MNKKCSECGTIKDIEEFSKRKDTKSGYRAKCKKCMMEKWTVYYGGNKEKRIIYAKEYRKNNADIIQKKDKARYIKNRHISLKQRKIYYNKNKESIKEKSRAYTVTHGLQISIYKKKYFQENKKKIASRRLEFKKSSPHKRIRCKISSTLSSRIKSKILNKCRKKEICGVSYTINDLMTHLESLFKPGMTWENYGEWHIDHIKPDFLFEYTSVEDKGFKESYALTNLQPLWKEDNIKKGKKFIEEKE